MEESRGRASLADRFARYVERGSPEACWPWAGASLVRGYGVIGLGGRKDGKILSHRLAWVLANGAIPEGEGAHGTVVRHKCGNRLCCNPAHLELGTQADNVADMWQAKATKRANARLSEEDAERIRKDPRSSRQLAPLYGVCHAHIRSIRRKRCWQQPTNGPSPEGLSL